MHLTGEQGVDVVRRVRAVSTVPPKFVCISGSVTKPKREVSDFDGFDAKPATLDDMRALLARWLEHD